MADEALRAEGKSLCERGRWTEAITDELFSSFRDIFCPLPDRRNFRSETICKCARCVLEKRLVKEIPALRKLERRCSKLWDRRLNMLWTHEGERVTVRNQCIEGMKSVEQHLLSNSKLQVLNASEKHWILSSFINFYRLLLEPTLALLPRPSESDQRLVLHCIFLNAAAKAILNVAAEANSSMVVSNHRTVSGAA